MKNTNKDYLTSREAAKMLGVAVSTIQLWTNNGLLQAWITGGGHRRIMRESVEKMLANTSSTATREVAKDELSVVVVEDDAQMQNLYTQQFKACQLKVELVTAVNGYEGLIKIGNTLPDAIITDLMMPNIDGFEMIRALEEVPELAQTTIIVVTGLDDDEIERNGGLPDTVMVLKKPVMFDRIESLLHEKLQAKAA